MIAYYLVRKDEKKSEVLPVKIVRNPEHARAALQPLRWRILCELAASPSYPKELAEKFRIEEQKIYYHIRALEKLGLIRVWKTEEKRGAIAKYYTADKAALTIIPLGVLGKSEAQFIQIALSNESRQFLEPFLTSEGLNATIVVGSPDAHGVFKTRARDSHYAIDLALLLGSLTPITHRLVTKLDTEVNETDLKKNLILIGGPRVNTIVTRINEKLPIRLELAPQTRLMSTITGKMYYEEECGVVERVSNPFNKDNAIMLFAGVSHLGTKAAIVAFIKHLEKIAKGNSANPEILARVVSGLDLNSDGIIDDIEFLE